MYERGSVAHSSELGDLAKLVDVELEKLEVAVRDAGRIPVIHQAPTKPRDGDVAYADGSDWDPGDGAGSYVFYNGTWTKNQEAGDYQVHHANLDSISALTVTSYGLSLLTVADATTLFNGIKVNASTTVPGVVEKAISAEVAAGTADKYLAADHLVTTAFALTDAAPVAVNWIANEQSFSLTVTADRQIGNPTNEIPNQFRTITVQGSDATPRTITFGSEFLGDVPTITDCSSTIWYDLYIRCVGTSHFAVSAKKVKG